MQARHPDQAASHLARRLSRAGGAALASRGDRRCAAARGRPDQPICPDRPQPADRSDDRAACGLHMLWRLTREGKIRLATPGGTDPVSPYPCNMVRKVVAAFSRCLSAAVPTTGAYSPSRQCSSIGPSLPETGSVGGLPSLAIAARIAAVGASRRMSPLWPGG
jgi:hypothetical protein